MNKIKEVLTINVRIKVICKEVRGMSAYSEEDIGWLLDRVWWSAVFSPELCGTYV